MQRTGERLLLAFLIARLSLCLLTVADPDGGVFPDSIGYLGLAQGLLEYGRYGVQPDGEADLLRPPMYSGFLALLQLFWGTDLADLTPTITLLQLAMSGLTAWLLVVLGRDLGRPGAGLAAGWLYALSPNVALWSLTVMTEVSFALLLTLITMVLLRAVQRSDLRWPLLAGLLLGALAYLRPIAITLLPVWAVIAYWSQRRLASKSRLVLAAGLLLVGALTVLPWAYRNWATYDKFTFSTATSKTWIGFNLAEVVAQGEGRSRNRAVATLDPEEGLIRLTLRVFSRYPGTFVKAQALGIVRTLLGSDIGTWGNVLGDDTWSGFGFLTGAFWGSMVDALRGLNADADPTFWIRALLTAYAGLHSLALIGLAVAGQWFGPPQGQIGGFFSVLAVSTALILLITPGAAGQARFRIPAEPLLSALAGVGAVWVGGRLKLLRNGVRRDDE